VKRAGMLHTQCPAVSSSLVLGSFLFPGIPSADMTLVTTSILMTHKTIYLEFKVNLFDAYRLYIPHVSCSTYLKLEPSFPSPTPKVFPLLYSLFSKHNHHPPSYSCYNRSHYWLFLLPLPYIARLSQSSIDSTSLI
jgi:hypothetical protein